MGRRAPDVRSPSAEREGERWRDRQRVEGGRIGEPGFAHLHAPKCVCPEQHCEASASGICWPALKQQRCEAGSHAVLGDAP